MAAIWNSILLKGCRPRRCHRWVLTSGGKQRITGAPQNASQRPEGSRQNSDERCFSNPLLPSHQHNRALSLACASDRSVQLLPLQYTFQRVHAILEPWLYYPAHSNLGRGGGSAIIFPSCEHSDRTRIIKQQWASIQAFIIRQRLPFN